MDFTVFGHAEFNGDVRFAVSPLTFFAWRFILYEKCIGVGTVGAVGAAAPPIFGQGVQTMHYAPPIF